MKRYAATLLDVNYKAKGNMPGNNAEANLLMTADVLYTTRVRGLPGFEGTRPLKETYVVETYQELKEKYEARLTELEWKAELYLSLKDAISKGAVVLAKPDIPDDSEPEDDAGENEPAEDSDEQDQADTEPPPPDFVMDDPSLSPSVARHDSRDFAMDEPFRSL